jgi:hypothetical protein
MDHCVTPGSSGSDTMLQCCHLQSSSPSGATTIGRGSGSSSPLLSSTSRDLELDESHNNNSGNGGGSSRGSNSRRSGFCQVCPTCVCVCERERERAREREMSTSHNLLVKLLIDIPQICICWLVVVLVLSLILQFYQRREDHREMQFQRNSRYHEVYISRPVVLTRRVYLKLWCMIFCIILYIISIVNLEF